MKKTNKSLPPNELTAFEQIHPAANWNDFRNNSSGEGYKALKARIIDDQGGSIEWFNRPDTFCAKLTKLWRVAMSDPQQASVLAAKLQDQLPAIQDWPALYEKGGMVELLDITRYLARETQPVPGNA